MKIGDFKGLLVNFMHGLLQLNTTDNLKLTKTINYI